MLTIQKFGGSSLADVEKLHRAAQLCVRERERGRDVVMVVSAMGGATDELLALAYSVSSAPEKRELDALLSFYVPLTERIVIPTKIDTVKYFLMQNGKLEEIKGI